MNKLRQAAGVLVGVALMATSTVVPASAAAVDRTTASSLIGTLSISVPATASLGSAPAGSASVSGTLGSVTVTDTRMGSMDWRAFASSTTFTSTSGATVSTSTAVRYNAGAITTTGTSVIPAAATVVLTESPQTVVGPAVVVGDNTATWNPLLTVSLPASALAGSYSGTVSTSVA